MRQRLIPDMAQLEFNVWSLLSGIPGDCKDGFGCRESFHLSWHKEKGQVA